MPLSAPSKNAVNTVLCDSRSLNSRFRRHFRQLLLYVNTARFWRPRQWFYLPLRRVLPDFYRPALLQTGPEQTAVFICDALNAVPHHCVLDGRFVFLNDRADFTVESVDWTSKAKSRLWRYNLHYFEYLSDPALTDDQRNSLIDSWIMHNTNVRTEGWEPYPVSLRIVSWVRYFDHLHRNGLAIPHRWLDSLQRQCDWLWQHREFHIDANHLLKNGIAVFIASCVLRTSYSPRSDRLYLASVRQLSKMLSEQFNQDGGHYERSPMYHLLCLHLCVDAYNALSLQMQSGGVSDDEKKLCESLRAVIEKGFHFASWMQHGNGCLAFFNDSAEAVAPDLEKLRVYAISVDASLPLRKPFLHGSLWFPESGYFCWHDDRRHLIFSAGHASPQYQPGHAHADCLAYELSINGLPVIVNAGNYCYELKPQRDYARSTAAHNTVEVDYQNQSELWSIFRLARRARVVAASPQTRADTIVFSAMHDGYRRLQPSLRHQREVTINTDAIAFVDRVLGEGIHQLRVFIHTHPAFRAQKINDSVIAIGTDNGVVALVEIDAPAGASIDIERTAYFPQFGIEQLRDSIIISCRTTLPQTLGHVIKLIANSDRGVNGS